MQKVIQSIFLLSAYNFYLCCFQGDCDVYCHLFWNKDKKISYPSLMSWLESEPLSTVSLIPCCTVSVSVFIFFSSTGLKNCCPIQQCQHSNFVNLPTSSLDFPVVVPLRGGWKPLYQFAHSNHFPVSQEIFTSIIGSRVCSWSDQRLHPVLLLRDILHPPMLYMYENGVLYTLPHPILCIGEYNNVNPKSTTILA